MKQGKTVLLTLLVLCMLLSVAACNNKPATTTAPVADPAVNTDAETPSTDVPATNAPQQEAIDWPKEPLDMTILFGAGGAADLIGRQLADLASRELGQPIVSNNRVGGGGAIGYQYLLTQKADGYNICWNSTSLNVVTHTGNFPNSYEDYKGVAYITEESSALAVKADAEWDTLESFIEYCKAHPGEVKVGNSGIGSFNHLIAIACEDAFGVEFLHIPLDGATTTSSLLGGQIDAMFNMAFEMVNQVEAGTMKVLGIIGDERIDVLADAPTMKEKGYDVTLLMWRGIMVKKDTPAEIVSKLEEVFLNAANSDEFKTFAAKYGVVLNPKGGDEFDEIMARDDVIVADLMKSIGGDEG